MENELEPSEYKLDHFKATLSCFQIKLRCDLNSDTYRLCDNILASLRNNVQLSLEEVSSLHIISSMLFVLGPNTMPNYEKRVELLNECFNYSDTLKPTMIDYFTKDLLDHFQRASSLDLNKKDYMLHLLQVIPHILVASETGKLVSMSLLRALIAEVTEAPPIVMHIYRSIEDIWSMIKSLKIATILVEWKLSKIYILMKSFELLLLSAAFGCNTVLIQAGYRGFDVPSNKTDMIEWFKTFRNENFESKTGTKLLHLIIDNILSSLGETETEEGAAS